jgi:signal transduction histidine kinase
MENCMAIVKIGLLFSSLGLSVFSIRYAWLNGRGCMVARWYIRVHFLLLIWVGAYLIRIFLNFCQPKWLVVMGECGAICFVGFCWLQLCLNYVKSPWLKRRNLFGLLMIPPLLTYLIILTNKWHHWYFTVDGGNFNQFGAFFYVAAVIAYLYCTVGNILILIFAFKQQSCFWRQALGIVIAGVIPIVANCLFVTNTFGWADFDLTPLSFNVSSLIILVVILKYRLFDLVPIALRKIVDQMEAIVIVVDNNDRIIEYNQALMAILPNLAGIKTGDPLQKIFDLIRLPYQSGMIIQDSPDVSGAPTMREIYLEAVDRWFSLHIQPLYANRVILGRIISLNEITEYKRLTGELQRKNTELTLLNRQLQAQAAVAEELATVKERQRVVQDIHDTLGQTMTLLVTALQLGKVKFRVNPSEAESKLDQALEFANRAVQQTRRALYGLMHSDKQCILSVILPDMINEFKTSGMNIQLKSEGEEYALNQVGSKIIYHLCQEALTNALRHGKSEHLTIKFNFSADKLRIEVVDDGMGCADFKPGIGLSGMQERIKRLKGRINFVCQPNAGFKILVELPRTQLLPGKNFYEDCI